MLVDSDHVVLIITELMMPNYSNVNFISQKLFSILLIENVLLDLIIMVMVVEIADSMTVVLVDVDLLLVDLVDLEADSEVDSVVDLVVRSMEVLVLKLRVGVMVLNHSKEVLEVVTSIKMMTRKRKRKMIKKMTLAIHSANLVTNLFATILKKKFANVKNANVLAVRFMKIID
jgi:hypothetical protein